MIEMVKPYPTYRDSGVSWLGDVPAHWRQLPGKACFREKKVSNTGMAEATVLSLSFGRIVVKPEERLHGLVPESFETYQIVDPGDIIVRSTDLQNDWNSLRVGLSRNRGIITSAYLCLATTRSLSQDYGYSLLNTYDLMKIFYGLGSGLRQNLGWRDFKYMPCLAPPLDEQEAIVRFLDYVERRIQRSIRAKQSLMSLLEEQKRAIVHEAVTRGLDPNASMKDSGVEWLGVTPDHWEVTRLGRVVKLTTGFPFKSEGFSQDESDIRLLRGINVAPGQIRWNEVVYWPANEREDLREYELREEDVVLGMDRPFVRAGSRVAKVGVEDVPSLLLQRVARIRPHAELNVDFALMVLGGKSFTDYLSPIFTGISVPHVSPDQIKSFRLALPPIAEQQEIVERVKAHTNATDATAGAAVREIALLREFRIRLIADVVTGKLDVREAAARLPNEAEDRVAIDDSGSLVDEAAVADPNETDEIIEESFA